MTEWGHPRRPYRLERLARYRLERWQARRAVQHADLDYRRTETPDRLARLIRARDHLRRLEWNPPR